MSFTQGNYQELESYQSPCLLSPILSASLCISLWINFLCFSLWQLQAVVKITSVHVPETLTGISMAHSKFLGDKEFSGLIVTCISTPSGTMACESSMTAGFHHCGRATCSLEILALVGQEFHLGLLQRHAILRLQEECGSSGISNLSAV